MAFPTATTQVSSQASNSTTSTITLPTHAAGDLLIAVAGLDVNASTSTNATGFTELKDETGSAFWVWIGYKIAASAAETLVLTHTTERSNHIALRIAAAAWHGTTPPEITAKVTGSSVSPDPGTVTPSWGAADNLIIAVSVNDDSAAPTYTGYPSGYTGNNVENGTAASAARVAVASLGVNATTANPGAFTLSGTETWSAYTIAVRPSAGTSASAGAATGTGAALADTAKVKASAGTGASTGAALAATGRPGTRALSGAAASTGAALAATATTADGSITFNATTATATAAAIVARASVKASTGVAQGRSS